MSDLESSLATARIGANIRMLLLMLMLFPIIFIPAGCTVEELPIDPTTVVDTTLETEARFEPDQIWDDRLTARDISWRLISAAPLRNSISAVGSFRISFVNADKDRAWQSQIGLRFRGGDGTLHVPETPLRRLFVAADSTVAIRENFIIEVADAQTANEIAQMTIVLF